MLIKICFLLMFIFSECLTTKITRLEVPEEIRLGEPEAEQVVLDCQYELESDEGLVLTWYFNQAMVYQWIKGLPPTVLSPFRDHLQLDFNISGVPTQQYRAMLLRSPDASFSGEYQCKVSTFVSEDVQKAHMQFFDPGQGPTLAYALEAGNDTESADDDIVAVQCDVFRVFPQPDLTISFNGEIVNQTQSTADMEEGVYNATATASVFAAALSEGAELRCDLTLPRTTYNSTDIVTYTEVESTYESSSGAAGAEGAAAVGAGSPWAAGHGSVRAASALLAGLAVSLCHLLQYQPSLAV